MNPSTTPVIEEGRFGLYERHKSRFDRFHLLQGKAALQAADGSILWEETEWQPNALADEGEQSMLNVYLLEQTNPSKYLGLLNMASPGETTVMSGITETTTPGSQGYDRKQIVAGSSEWGTPTLTGGDYKSTAAQKTFGPASSSSWTCTHAYVTTTSTGTSGKFLLYLALSASTTVAVGQSFLYTLGFTQS